MSELVTRVKSNTPSWFKKIRNIGLVLTGIGTAIVTAPVALPTLVVTFGGYAIVAGSVAAAIAATAKEGE